MEKKLTIGIMAHVDAGKTTLCEAMLYTAGNLRRFGRVDHKDAHLDTHEIEKNRGITIFSKQAILQTNGAKITLLDTPGHVDFVGETQRTLMVQDCVILVISATHGVQSHTVTLFKMLKQHNIPIIIFVNKTDVEQRVQNDIMLKLNALTGGGCINFTNALKNEQSEYVDLLQEQAEQAALQDSSILNDFVASGKIFKSHVANAISNRKIFPCYFGSALKLTGINELLNGITALINMPQYKSTFSAQVFKIDDDDQGKRQTHIKITGGEIGVKQTLTFEDENAQTVSEKIESIRIYDGKKYNTVQTATAGMVCAITGPCLTYAGLAFGAQKINNEKQIIEPYLKYKIEILNTTDIGFALEKLQSLTQQDPMLNITYNEKLGEIHVNIMGEIQIQVLKAQIKSKFNIDVEFLKIGILYKETIESTVIGIGHFEPLKHYAEVHLKVEPLPQNSGIILQTQCREDMLDKNYQSSVLNCLKHKKHTGVLLNAPITDIKITLIAGKAHKKHTSGADFRHATNRALRNALKKAKSIVLQPVYSYTLSVPQSCTGKAMSDIQRMYGKIDDTQTVDNATKIKGLLPVATAMDYAREVNIYTNGEGELLLQSGGYAPSHNSEEIIEEFNYNSDTDEFNIADSIFCEQGTSYTVKWWDVHNYAHITNYGDDEKETDITVQHKLVSEKVKNRAKTYCESLELDKELLEIFERTYGKIKKDPTKSMQSVKKPLKPTQIQLQKPKSADIVKQAGPQYLLVDGYNVIYAWDELKQIAQDNLDGARRKLIDILCNHTGIIGCQTIVVFDAYKVKGNPGEVQKTGNIHVIYTKEAETADMYIEKTTHSLARQHYVRVVTSDSLEQLIIMGHGAMRVSARAFLQEVESAVQTIKQYLQ